MGRPSEPYAKDGRRQRRRGSAAGYLVFVVLKLASIPVVAASVALSVYVRTSPYPPTEALMHLIARAGCPSAAAIGLAPARRGALGYHARNDPDGDGIACDAGQRLAVPVTLTSPPAADIDRSRNAGGAKFIRPDRPAGG